MDLRAIYQGARDTILTPNLISRPYYLDLSIPICDSDLRAPKWAPRGGGRDKHVSNIVSTGIHSNSLSAYSLLWVRGVCGHVGV